MPEELDSGLSWRAGSGLVIAMLPIQLLMLIACTQAASLASETEMQALVAFYDLTGGSSSWRNTTGWLDDSTHHCDWHGVQCSSGTVTGISLTSNGLIGTLPDQLFALTQLTACCGALNGISGTIGQRLSVLNKMRYLQLSENALSGTMPAISSLTGLKGLWLDSMPISGTIPDQISSEFWMMIMPNRISGTIPDQITSLTLLVSLALGKGNAADFAATPLPWQSVENYQMPRTLSGTLPNTLSKLTALRYLNLFNNSISGTVVDFMGCKDMSVFRSNDNAISGTLGRVGSLQSMKNLDLFSNLVSGTLGQIGSGMQSLQLFNNSISGSIESMPDTLQYLVLHRNKLTGVLPSLQNLSALTVVMLFDNELTGKLQLPDLKSRLVTVAEIENATCDVDCDYIKAVESPVVLVQNNRLSCSIKANYTGAVNSKHSLVLPGIFRLLLLNREWSGVSHCR